MLGTSTNTQHLPTYVANMATCYAQDLVILEIKLVVFSNKGTEQGCRHKALRPPQPMAIVHACLAVATNVQQHTPICPKTENRTCGVKLVLRICTRVLSLSCGGRSAVIVVIVL